MITIHIHGDIHVHPAGESAILAKVDDLAQQVAVLIQEEKKEMAAIDDLTAQVHSNTTVIGSALTLIQGFQAKLDAAIAAGPAALNALSAELKQNDDALAAAVAANTPVDNGGGATP